MVVELDYEPAAPATGDAMYFTVTGSLPDPVQSAAVIVEADGDELQRSPVFGQEDAPEGTGQDRFTLQVFGGTDGDFTLEVYEYGDTATETDPIYYFSDAQYTYPDTDDVTEALEAALPGLEVDATKEGSTMTIKLGGQYSGKNMRMTIDPAGITGSETTALVDASQQTGPFRWGPVTLAADDYTADVVAVGGAEDGDSLLAAPVTFTVTS